MFQVLIKPGSYKVRRATSPLNGPSSSVQVTAPTTSPDSVNQLLNTSAETTVDETTSVYWYTKERGAAIIQSLLVKLDDFASLTANS